MNKSIDKLMSSIPHVGLTFDDVSLVTAYAEHQPADSDIKTQFSRNISLYIPFVSAAMDTVTESKMAITMARLGGIGVVHKNLTIENQAREVKKVKQHSNGVIQNPVTFNINDTVNSILDAKRLKQLPFSGFPILDDNHKLCGILTAKDIKFVTDYDSELKKVMTKEIITATYGTSLTEAFDIMTKNKIGKLPLVNSKGKLMGLYSFHDVKALNSDSNNNVNFDDKYQLRVAAAISPMDFDRVEALVDAGVDALVIDTAHGHSKDVIQTIKDLKNSISSQVDVVAGNVGTYEGAKALSDAGVDGVKVGIGPGSICTTRVVAGVGVPQITAVYNAKRGVAQDVPIIADGGIRQSGDVAKAIAIGADSVMAGSLLAGTEESPGEKIIHQGRRFVVYRGMGSLEAMKSFEGSRERYSQGNVENSNELIPQGIEARVPYRGDVASVLHQYAGGLKYSLGYCGSKNIKKFQETAEFVQVTSAGLREAHPHDVHIVKDAPNYRTV